MTPDEKAELLAFARRFKREQRAAKVRAGLVAPRTYREIAMWREGVEDRFGLSSSLAHVANDEVLTSENDVPLTDIARASQPPSK